MQSLRTRRPSDGLQKAPKQQQQKLAKSPSRRAGGNARKSRVDDKIKKRMSMRYADISAPTDALVPEMPTLPIGMRRGGMGIGVGASGSGMSGGMGRITEDEEVVKEPQEEREDTRASDLRLLERENFDPEAYLKAKMANSTEAEIRSLQSYLQLLMEDTNVDLRRNVFKNYEEFMMISKEVSTLENDMLELKESLSEWKSMPSLLHINDAASLADRKRIARSSVADLRVLYASQMQTLHAQIEGSSKFIPAIPGRHIITEMEDISMLNAATFRVENSVKFVLLDDAVLVARKRTRRTADRPVFVAERSWPLNDILVLDTKDTPTLTNVFKIRHAKETFVFRTDLTSDKRSLLAQFRQVAEELAAKKRKEREGEHERRKSMWMSGGNDRRSFILDPDMPAMPDWMNELALREGLGGAKDKEDKDVRWVNEMTDELTVCIALREWDKAVSLVEQGEAKLSATPILEPKLTALKKSLTSAILHALSEPTLRKNYVLEYTALLQRLHTSPADRNAFLAARAELTRRRIRTIRAEGHIPMYIADLAFVVFTGIKHTAEWYLASYKQHDAGSSLVEWSKKQIENFAELFRKQVFTSDVDQKTVDECIKITHDQGKKILAEFGFDFQYLFDQLLVPHPVTPIVGTSGSSHASPSISTVEGAFKSLTVRASTPVKSERSPSARRPPPGAPPPRSRNRPPSTADLRSPAPPLTPKRQGMF